MRDYDSIAYLSESLRDNCLVEVYSGEGIVGWHGNIERQIDRMLTTYEAARNRPYVDKLSTYLKIWRGNPLSGSINIEDINILVSGAEVLAVDNWNLKDYFSNLRDQLNKLKASEEELPRSAAGIQPNAGPKPRIGSIGKELASDFGPDADKLATPPAEELPPTPEAGTQLPQTA
jgi:hypothetical protein